MINQIPHFFFRPIIYKETIIASAYPNKIQDLPVVVVAFVVVVVVVVGANKHEKFNFFQGVSLTLSLST